jgi:hypothetical protein
MNKSIYILGIIIAALIFSNLFTCNSSNFYRKNLEAKIAKQKVELTQKENALISIESTLKDTIEVLTTKIASVKAKVETIRIYSSKKIDAAKSLSEELAEEYTWNRFNNYQEIAIFSEISDSIKLEVNSLIELNSTYSEALNKSKLLNNNYGERLKVKDDFLILKDEKIDLLKISLKEEKKKRRKAIIKSFVIGVPVGIVGYIIAKDFLFK